jgi:hypothetical protein
MVNARNGHGNVHGDRTHLRGVPLCGAPPRRTLFRPPPSVSPEGCGILAGDNIPGRSPPTTSRPEGALECLTQHAIGKLMQVKARYFRLMQATARKKNLFFEKPEVLTSCQPTCKTGQGLLSDVNRRQAPSSGVKGLPGKKDSLKLISSFRVLSGFVRAPFPISTLSVVPASVFICVHLVPLPRGPWLRSLKNHGDRTEITPPRTEFFMRCLENPVRFDALPFQRSRLAVAPVAPKFLNEGGQRRRVNMVPQYLTQYVTRNTHRPKSARYPPRTR